MNRVPLLGATLLLLLTPLAGAGEAKGLIQLFDGTSLGNWKPLSFGGEGAVYVEEGAMHLDQGSPMTGVVWTGEVPARNDFEISLKAKKVAGDDFFLALTFPVNDSHCSLVVGGWGGGLVGLSSINGMDASENGTTTVAHFEKGKWYSIRVRVHANWITCFIDDKPCVDIDIAGCKIGLRPGEIELCAPLGLATYETWAAYRDVTWRALTAEEASGGRRES